MILKIMTQPTIDISQLEQIILQKLPTLIQKSPQIQELVLELARQNFADRQATEDKFYQLLNELRRDREEQARKWDEQNQKWDEQNQKWDEQNQKWDEQNQKWDEQNRKWEDFKQELQRDREEQAKKWDEQARKWDEQNHKWEDFKQELQRDREEQAHKWDKQNQKWEDAKLEFARMHEAIMAIAQKQERSIGALGARWGIQAESAFRNALAGILEKSFGVEVVNVNEYDDQGEVFGRPDQVELDVIIKNGLLIICEIKSSIDKAGMYIFERKVRFYEKRHQRQANRLLVISPMVDSKAQPVADRLGIEVYSDSVDVKKL
ncbi:hypothetical protein THII_1315 [Thioploca ingrica]|uniref:DUF3782 domain-containing protein n=1 Tax=Thioploca ingrica TaxID=40754 RepID=A0A090AJB8_9GAMM|nr:hypothetical protein THII_1315 [Thioploca ingrica]